MLNMIRQGLAAAVLLLSVETVALAAQKLPYDAFLQDIVDVRISDAGLNFLAELLGNGLLQPTLRSDIVGALEDQRFVVLIPNDLGGGYAEFVVDHGFSSPTSEQDGFRYDDLTVELTTVPAATNLVPEAGVLYPKINLLGWSGSAFEDQLPELWLRVNYPPFITDVPAVARARLNTTGVLRPYVGEGGTVGFLVENFDSQIFEFKVDPFGASATAVQDLLGELVIDAFSKELEDALADVLQQGINDILFDRDLDGEADVLLNVQDIFVGLNEALNTDFGFAMVPKFQTNPTLPTTVLLRTDGSMFLQTPGECVGADVDAGFKFTDFELDGVAGHDPPTISETAPGAEEPAQFVLTLSDDFLNQVLFNAYRTGFACLFLNPLAPGVPTDIAELLTTKSLEIFLGDWITDLFPDAPVGLRARLLRAPSATIPAAGPTQLQLHLPNVQIDVMVFEHDRWLRLMGASATLGLGVGIDNISLTGTQFLDAFFSFDVSSTVNFLEFAPEHRETLEGLLPTAISLAEGAIAGIIGSPGEDITGCVAGLDLGFFELAPLGIDPSGDFAHYLGLWISLTGSVDLGLLFECLLGAPLVDTAATDETAPTLAPTFDIPVVAMLGVDVVAPERLAGVDVVRWRFDPGFYHPGNELVPPIGFGLRTWVWEDANGVERRLRLMGGHVEPRWQAKRQGQTWVFEVDSATPIAPETQKLELIDGDNVIATAAVGRLSVDVLDVHRRQKLKYRDSWGRDVSVDVDDVLPNGRGCGLAPSGGGSVAVMFVLLLAYYGLRQRKYIC